MFMDGRIQEGANRRDDDGAKRVFFGGERFLEGISGQAYVNYYLSFEMTFIYILCFNEVISCLLCLLPLDNSTEDSA